MKLAPQEIRTFFVTSVTHKRRVLFLTDRNAELFLDVLRQLRSEGKIALHAFVAMPDHFHLLLTPAHDIPLEKAIQFVKGRYSFRAKKELGILSDVWQPGFKLHRIIDSSDFFHHANYIVDNPVRAGLGTGYHYVSRNVPELVDPPPTWMARAKAAHQR